MKKIILAVLVIAVALLVYRMFSNKKNGKSELKPDPLAINKNTSIFNLSFDRLLSSYYTLKDALVESDTLKANQAAIEMIAYSDSLALKEIKGDSTGVIRETALSFAGTISGSSKALALEKNIEAKRREFEMITEALWNLSRVVRYDGEKIYYLFCPMAFDDKGAYWLSNKDEVRNPYFGNKMLTCGSIADSLDYGSN